MFCYCFWITVNDNKTPRKGSNILISHHGTSLKGPKSIINVLASQSPVYGRYFISFPRLCSVSFQNLVQPVTYGWNRTKHKELNFIKLVSRFMVYNIFPCVNVRTEMDRENTQLSLQMLLQTEDTDWKHRRMKQFNTYYPINLYLDLNEW